MLRQTMIVPQIKQKFIFIFALLFSSAMVVTTMSATTYAGYDCSDNNSIIVSQSGIEYIDDSIDRNTAVYNQGLKTLTLNGYNGGSICFDEFGNMTIITVILQNNNRIVSNHGKAGLDFKDGVVKFKGDGTLALEGTHAGIDAGGALVIDSGTISLSQDGIIESNCIVMRGGKITVSQNAMVSVDILIMNDGIISGSGQIAAVLFNQNGGNIAIENNQEYSTDHHNDPIPNNCFTTVKAVFNAGSMDIDCASPAFLVKYNSSSISAYSGNSNSTQEDGGIIKGSFIDAFASSTGENVEYAFGKEFESIEIFIPVDSGIFAVFRGGDIKLKSQTAAFLARREDSTNSGDLESLTSGGLIKLVNGMIMDPASATAKGFTYNGASIHTFTDDGEDVEYSVDESNQEYHTHTSSNVTKNIHIYKSSSNSSQPSDTGSGSDSSQNGSLTVPNTIDSALFSIISTIIVSIIAEVFIIIDLRKRIYSTQDEIVNEEAKTINSYIDSISSKPEEKE